MGTGDGLVNRMKNVRNGKNETHKFCLQPKANRTTSSNNGKCYNHFTVFVSTLRRIASASRFMTVLIDFKTSYND